jgi:hypothetical protein
MSIKCPAILLIACAVAASTASAETAQQDGSSLPQFMSSAGRAELAQEKNSASHITRQAAEEISAKFAGGDRAATVLDTAAPAASDPRTDPKTSAHVAVLVTTDSSSAENSKDSNSDQTKLKPTTTAQSSSAPSSTTQPTGSKVKRKHAQARTEERSDANAPPMRFASNALPGADVGWRTGLIGMLTNPIFWH